MVIGTVAAAAQGALLLAQAGTAAQATALGTGLVANPTLTGTALDAPVPMDLMLGGGVGFDGYAEAGSFEDVISQGVSLDDGDGLTLAALGGGGSLDSVGQFGIPSYDDQGHQSGVDAVMHAPQMPHQPGFGRHNTLWPNFFESIESPHQTREGLRDVANTGLSLVSDDLEIPRPTGQMANTLDAAVFALGLSAFMALLHHEYSRRVFLPGSSSLRSSLKMAAYIFGVTVLGQRLGVDLKAAALRGEEFEWTNSFILSNALYSDLAIWSLFGFVWAWIARVQYPAARFWFQRIMPGLTLREPLISTTGQFHPATAASVEGFFKSVKSSDAFSFNVPAEYLAAPDFFTGGIGKVGQSVKDLLGRVFPNRKGSGLFSQARQAAGRLTYNTIRAAVNSLSGLVNGPRMKPYQPRTERPAHSPQVVQETVQNLRGVAGEFSFGASGSDFGEKFPVVQGLRAQGLQVTASHTTVRTISATTPSDKRVVVDTADGIKHTVLAGSWIRGKEEGTRVKLSRDMEVTDPVVVLSGTVQETGTLEIPQRARDLRRYASSNVTFTIKTDDLGQTIPVVAKALAQRPVTRPYWRERFSSYLNPYSLVTTVFRLPSMMYSPAARWMGLPDPTPHFVHAIRRWLAETPLEVTAYRPAGAGQEFHENLAVVAGHRVRAARLHTPPTVPVRGPIVDYVIEEGSAERLTISISERTFRGADTGLLGELKRFGQVEIDRDPDRRRILLTAPATAIQRLSQNPESVLAGLSRRGSLEVLRRGGRPQIVLPNPYGDPGTVWKLVGAEAFALKVSRGDTRTLEQFYEDTKVVRRDFGGFFGGNGRGAFAGAWHFLYDLTAGQVVGLARLTATMVKGGAKTMFRPDRVAAMAAVAIGGGIIAYPIVAAKKIAAGWHDLVVAHRTGSRVFVTGGLNAVINPGLLAHAGRANFDGFISYAGSMTLLRLIEFFNEGREQARLLYKQLLQDLGDEDRPEARRALAERIVELEATSPDLVRKDILKLRLVFLLDTGVVRGKVDLDGNDKFLGDLLEAGLIEKGQTVVSDFDILKFLYEEAKTNGGAEGAAHFLLALGLNESLLEVMQQPHLHPDTIDPEEAPTLWAYWQAEFVRYGGDVELLRGRYFSGADQTAAEKDGGTETFARR